MKVLIISPNGGFANRMRTLSAGFLIAELTGRTIYHWWEIDNTYHPNECSASLNPKKAGLDGYFTLKDCPLAPLSNPDICYTEWLPHEYWYSRQSNGQKKWIPNQLVKYTNTDDILNDNSSIILIESSFIYKPSSIPVDQWQSMLTSAYKRYFYPLEKYLNLLPNTQYDIGISIRRNEFLYYFPEANQSMDDIIAWINKMFKDKSVIIFSDDQSFRDAVRIATGKLNCIDDESLEEWEKGFVVFLTLAKCCNSIYGTPSSSFSFESALFGGRPWHEILHV